MKSLSKKATKIRWIGDPVVVPPLAFIKMQELRNHPELQAHSTARSRIVSTADRFAEVAVSWITPCIPFGRPRACRNQSTITVSNSVAAGEVCQSIHCAEIALDNCSANIKAGAAFELK